MKKKLLDLIAAGKLKAALDLMRQIGDTQSNYFSDPLINLMARFNRNEQSQNSGTISTENYNIEFNKIVSSAKNLIDNELDESLVPPDLADKVPESNPSAAATPAASGPRPLHIFISYSKMDKDYRDELDVHLASLRRRNKANSWDDRHLIAGDTWDDVIKNKLKQADIILFLVSPGFIATDYIWDHEIPLAEEQRKAGKTRVIPIILKPCQWEKLEFAKQQALPFKGIPVSEYPNRDAAWVEIVNAIETVINNMQA